MIKLQEAIIKDNEKTEDTWLAPYVGYNCVIVNDTTLILDDKVYTDAMPDYDIEDIFELNSVIEITEDSE